MENMSLDLATSYGTPHMVGPEEPSPAIVTGSSGLSSSDSFYEKLSKFYEPSGLSLVFNFRETILDLYLFYKDVTEKGGFHQVTKEGKWDEVASAMSLKSSMTMLPIQLQKLYANLLFQFEQIYYFRAPVKPAAAPGHPSSSEDSSTWKRKRWDTFSQLSTDHSGIGDGPMVKRKCENNSCQFSTGSRTAEQKLSPQTPSKNKELKKDPDAPMGLRSAYQIFLKKECVRLKKMHGEGLGGQNVRNMAIDAWRCLSKSDRQPYVEESKKDRERFNQEMSSYKKRQNMQNTKMGTKTENGPCNSKANVNSHQLLLQKDGDYHVTLGADAENFLVPDKSMVELAVGMMMNARPYDPIFQINWDDYCGSLDIPS